jgi:diguanylate cyclase (GGDEF)-like protein
VHAQLIENREMSLEVPQQKYQLDPFTLSFQNTEVEQRYRQSEPIRLLPYIRPGLVIVILVVGLFGLLDSLILPEIQTTAWEIRLYLAISILAVLALTYTAFATHLLQISLFILMLLFGFSNIALILAVHNAETYFVGLVLILMYGYFSGLRFTYALLASSIVVASYVLLSLTYIDSAHLNVLVQIPLLIAAFLISGFAGYTAERQRRLLFAQTRFMEEERVAQEKLAMHDPLTELPNRNLFQEKIEQSFARVKRQHNQFAVMFMDLDNFKTVNDNYGHIIGDQVLITIANRLRKHVRTEDTVARFGGDEFVVLSENITDKHNVQIAANRMLAEIAQPITLSLRETDKITINITASIGISLCPQDGTTLKDLVENADDAMYSVKREGKGSFKFFNTTPKTA